MGKVITMSSANPQPASGSEVPFTPSDIRNLSLAVDIYQRLGALAESVSNLKDDTRSNYERIEQLIQWTIAIPNLEKDVQKNTKDLNELGAQHNKDLNELGRRLEKDVNALGARHDKDIKELEKIAHTASAFGKIAFGVAAPVAASIIVAVLIFVYHHLAPIPFP
jgi:DNA repair exonuclease SbcCD ATPase subunit